MIVMGSMRNDDFDVNVSAGEVAFVGGESGKAERGRVCVTACVNE